MYYLNARYYDPEVCRFISPDDISYLDPETIGGTNLYAYCNNNPVMYVDPTGHWWDWFWKMVSGIAIGIGLAVATVVATIINSGSFVAIGIGFGIGAISSFVGQGVGNLLKGKDFFEDMSIASIIMGGLAGAAYATGMGGFLGAVAIGAASNAGASALDQKSWATIGLSTIVGGLSSGAGYGIGRLIVGQIF